MKHSTFNIIIPPQDIGERPGCVEQIFKGDHDTFTWLYKNYCGRLYDYIYLLSCDKVLAEDLVQEVFAKVWMNRKTLAGIKNINAYLYATAKNHLLNVQQKGKREKQYAKELSYLLCTHTHTDPLLEKEKKTLLYGAVGSLTERQRLIYRLIREDGRTREEISKALKISPFTVKNTMKNALRGIRERLLANRY